MSRLIDRSRLSCLRLLLASGTLSAATDAALELSAQDLSFHGRDMRPVTEPGAFDVWIGGNTEADLQTEYSIIEPVRTSPVRVEGAAPR